MRKINGISESELVVRLKLGDVTAFDLLFHFYYPGMVVYASQLIADRDLAEELVQDFFVRLWQKHTSLFPTDSLKNYFFSSVKNSALNFLKHKKIEKIYIEKLNNLALSNIVYNPDIYVATELQQKIVQTVGNLPEKCRDVFVLSRYKGLKNDEIATEMNISKRTVETHIHHALKVLRHELKEYIGVLLLLGLFPM
jgi:RNA polymerase sigma-70 factor, ECF subfamily